MRTAKCTWPIEDIDLEFERAIIQAKADLPRIVAENGWAQASEPRDWREAEGVDAHNNPALYLVCELDVEVHTTRPATIADGATVGLNPPVAA